MESVTNRGNWEWTTGEFQTIVTGRNLFLVLYLCFPSLLFTKRLLFIHNSLPQGTLPFCLNVKPKCLCSGKHLDCVHRRMVAWLLCPILGTRWTVAHQTALSLGFSRQKYWNGLPFSLQVISQTQESNPGLLHCMKKSFTNWAKREAQMRTAARNKKLTHLYPEAGHSRRYLWDKWPFYFTSSLFMFYKRTWNPDPGKIGILRH